MGLSHGFNGADSSAALASVVNDFIRKQGGVTGLINQFEKQGLGASARSWIGKGESHPVTDAQIFRALGYATLQELGGQVGLSPDETAAALSNFLPKAIGKLAAEGSRAPTPPPSIWSYFTGATR
jgi:uncharacterized protein YidB (DUF937 family)